ncbi:hypothetical protein HMPREF1078_03080 [Parabacteroides merdae CL09T00C40]|nr:hypothetical protein HMPREF1078_03080 [Parabacteroides merdae CL09T00C40]
MNIYCFSTLSFAKLQFKSVINKAFHKHGVASFTDAWIETNQSNFLLIPLQSHLLQMRGLKHKTITLNGVRQHVASFTDAWIETSHSRSKRRLLRSHLLQMRGLKRERDYSKSHLFGSHLLQMRGLKQRTSPFNTESTVASFTDAWIETR